MVQGTSLGNSIGIIQAAKIILNKLNYLRNLRQTSKLNCSGLKYHRNFIFINKRKQVMEIGTA